MSGPKLAWQEWSEEGEQDSGLNLDSLCDQFATCLELCGNLDTEEPTTPGDEDVKKSNPEDLEVNSDAKLSEPFKNKYKARIILLEMQAILLTQETDASKQDQVAECLLVIRYQLGAIALSVEEFSTGEEHLMHICDQMKRFSGEQVTPRRIILLIGALNKLGVLWCQRGEQSRAKELLLRASDAYDLYKETFPEMPAVPVEKLLTRVQEPHDDQCNIADNICICHGNTTDLETTHTLSLYYLAQVTSQLGEIAASSRYCYATLSRQLRDRTVFDASVWAKNAAVLSSSYVGQRDYRVARYLLCAACVVLETVPLEQRGGEVFLKAEADVCWKYGQYCQALLSASADLLENPSAEDAVEDKEETLTPLEGVDATAVAAMEALVPVVSTRGYDGARTLFLEGVRRYTKVTAYYTLNDHASLHVEATQGVTRLYQSLAAFETDNGRKSKLQKRRVNLLSHLLAELNPQFYLQACRQLRYELAESYSYMVVCKEEAATSQAQKDKLVLLISNSIQQFQKFIDTFGTPGTAFPPDTERAALVAHFSMGRLWYKMPSVMQSNTAYCWGRAVRCFQAVNDYVKQFPESEVKISSELSLCRELSALLTAKLGQV